MMSHPVCTCLFHSDAYSKWQKSKQEAREAEEKRIKAEQAMKNRTNDPFAQQMGSSSSFDVDLTADEGERR